MSGKRVVCKRETRNAADSGRSKRKIHLHSTYLPLKCDNDCNNGDNGNPYDGNYDTCILFRYNDGFTLIKLNNNSMQPMKAWKTIKDCQFPFQATYMSPEAMSAEVSKYSCIYANNLELLDWPFNGEGERCTNAPVVRRIINKDIRRLVDELVEDRAAVLASEQASQKTIFDFNYYKSLDPSITFKDYRELLRN